VQATAPPVEVLQVSTTDVPIYTEYPAQTFARNLVEVRGRVNGYVEKWLFKPGSHVKAGDMLYVLDTRPYQAAVQQAAGNLRQSEADLEFARQQVSLLQAEANLNATQANLKKAQQDYERLKPLVEQDAASKQDLDAAIAALHANEANLRAAQANVDQIRLSTRTQIQSNEGKVESLRGALENAQINLNYATIRAPIGGLIGDTLVPVGGLVSSGATQALTTIVPLDPMYARFKVSEAQYLSYVRRYGWQPDEAPLELILADRSVFPNRGEIENALNQVDPKTGTLELQARFPNPQHTLLPGQFGQIRLRAEERHGVIVVPQRAVQQVQSMQTVYTVGPGNKVLARAVKTGDRVGEGWIIEQGLEPGERVVVEGQLRVRPGMTVTPVPYKNGTGESKAGG
jgi:membrane fusion protein (multidrug efflux system)